MAIQTGFPPAFFDQDPPTGFPVGSHFLFRARVSVSARDEARAHRFAEILHEASTKLRRRVTSIPVRLPQLHE